ncbi:uncharacterized protein TNCV_2456071 [Trichonephila clavipes]|nr:uncharacterized protein TNCV_2456071 [Trichonephila clavipes]
MQRSRLCTRSWQLLFSCSHKRVEVLQHKDGSARAVKSVSCPVSCEVEAVRLHQNGNNALTYCTVARWVLWGQKKQILSNQIQKRSMIMQIKNLLIAPKNSKEVSKFLGMSQWFKKCLWSVEPQNAFDAVKSVMTEAPILKLPDLKKPFEWFMDASSRGIGAVLNQRQRPVVFASRMLSSAERNYTVTERDCLAVALNKSRTYLGSLPVTDHVALTRLTNS